MNSVVHFELPAEDHKRAANFYAKAFGWGTEILGPEMNNYVTLTTVETDASGPKVPGAINGGIFTKTDDMPAQYPSVVIAVDDMDEALNSVKANGGQVLGEPMQIPTVGLYVSILDTEGNRIALLKPEPRSVLQQR